MKRPPLARYRINQCNILPIRLYLTYLMKKTHLQLAELLMAPPSKGPSSRDIAKTPESMLEYDANFSGGTSSKNITNTREYVPASPMPCIARKKILDSCKYSSVGVKFGMFSLLVHRLGSCTCARKYKRQSEVVMTIFRPKISLSLAQMIKNSVQTFISQIKD